MGLGTPTGTHHRMIRFQALVALAIFLATVHAAELSMGEQLGQCHLQLAQSNGENARLRAEIRDLRSQLRLTGDVGDVGTAVKDETAVNLDDMTMLANSASTVDDFLQEEGKKAPKAEEKCERPKGIPEWYGMAH